MLESSVELCLHYTETESQEIKDKTSQDIQKEISDFEIKEDLLNQNDTEASRKQIDTTESPKSHELVLETGSENIICNISNADKINLSEKDVLALSLEENFECNSIFRNKDSSAPSEALLKDVFSEQSSSTAELRFLEPENNSEITDNNNENHKALNRSIRLKPDVKFNKIPKLSGQPDEVIDFEKSPEKPGAVKLISRFMKHITLKPKIKVQENVV